MIELNRQERARIRTLERRLDYLSKRLATTEGRELIYTADERSALLWVLEVVDHALATNCEEAFAYTVLRQNLADERRAGEEKHKVDMAVETANYLARSRERQAAHTAKLAAEAEIAAARKAAKARLRETPAPAPDGP